MKAFEFIKENKLIAVIRGAREENVIKISNALEKGSVRILEFTTETPNAIEAIRTIAETDNDEILVGAGTVLDAETARLVILAGAKFVVSPIVNVDIIKMCNRYGVLSVIGALTPTEILTAYENGADVVKCFPANSFGPSYLKDLKGPLSHIPIIPTGGINVENVNEYLDASGIAVGLGSSLVNTSKLLEEKDYEKLTERAMNFSKAIQKQNHSLQY
ncbi:bifunctional 4-hydroxy-2-oxoglutarate aldolase/2-dehydro-3-deoxy-phosphogluconate aldolase [Priestia megaterium]